MLSGAAFEFGDADGVLHAEGAAAGAPQGGEVGAAAELLPDVVGVGADVEAFAAMDAEVDFAAVEVDAGDVVVDDADAAAFALDVLPFAGEFVAGDAVDFDGGVHGRGLVEFTAVVFEGGADVAFAEGVDGVGGGDAAVGVLGVGFDAEFHGGGVFFVRTHEAVLQFGGFADDDEEQAGGHGVEGAAVADFAGLQDAAAEGDGVVGGEAGVFVDEEDAVGAGGGGGFAAAHGVRGCCVGGRTREVRRVRRGRGAAGLRCPRAVRWRR